MFTQLVLKEMKYQVRNITFYLLIAVVLMFYITQFMPYISQVGSLEPQPGKDRYGFKEITDKTTEIKAVYLEMSRNYSVGEILKQGLLINKTVRLSKEQMAELKASMDKLGYLKDGKAGRILENVEVKASYDEYLQTVDNLDKALGGSTYYSYKYREYILQQPMTYEDAKKEFESIKTDDKITNAYGRVFADYMGITAGLFPVFLSAFVLTRDRRSRMQELIYSRSISSTKYVAAKYLGILVCLIAIYLGIAVHATVASVATARQAGYAVAGLAFFKYTVAWIIPTLMFSSAAGMLVSLLFGNGIAAIFVQFVLWLISITSLGGSYELFRNVIRFNTLGSYEKYISWLPQITANRIFYTILSIIIVIASAWGFSLKRGAAYGFKSGKADMVQHQNIT